MLVDNSPVAALVSRAGRAVGARDDGVVLGFHPVARLNPFQALLYSRAHQSGFAPVGLVSRSDIETLRVARSMGAGAVLHLHWTTDVLAEALDESDASRRAGEFIQLLQELHDDGVIILWTVHNVLPHRCPFPGVEANLRARIAEVCDVVHVMNPDTLSQTTRYYEIPEAKVIIVPHPSYVGAYPMYSDGLSERFEFGYDASNFVLGAVGSIQPYKGLSEFSRAVEEEMLMDPDIRALVAGIPGRDDSSKELIAELRGAVHLDLMPKLLADAEIASIMSALDVAVLPYRASLNSGAALLALSFGVPILAPMTGEFVRLIEKGLGLGYELDSPDGLSGAIRSAREFVEGFEPDAAIELASSLAGPVVSETFFSELRARI